VVAIMTGGHCMDIVYVFVYTVFMYFKMISFDYLIHTVCL